MRMYVDMVVPFIAENADNVEYINNDTVRFQVDNYAYYIMIYPEKIVLACEGITLVSEYFNDSIKYFMGDIHDILDR